jgi:hypothetical protein
VATVEVEVCAVSTDGLVTALAEELQDLATMSLADPIHHEATTWS